MWANACGTFSSNKPFSINVSNARTLFYGKTLVFFSKKSLRPYPKFTHRHIIKLHGLNRINRSCMWAS
ncbi:hypothetical protein SDC9_110387 [bioreactor metagenome]|uniref:Uncharacterized protein n=1 Tax=bioreactor metagenome TaxID=1076179 RepID=A0A645BDU8_9ZZZZ